MAIINSIQASGWDVTTITILLKVFGYYLGFDWSNVTYNNNIDRNTENLLEQILPIIFQEQAFLQKVHSLSSHEMLEETMITLDHQNLEISNQISIIRQKIVKFLSEWGYEISGKIGQLDGLLYEIARVFQARNIFWYNILYEESITAVVSQIEIDLVQKIDALLKTIQLQQLPISERQQVILSFCQHFYNMRKFDIASQYLVQGIESGLNSPIVFYNYFVLGLMAGEFDAALQGYNNASTALPDLAFVPQRYKLLRILERTRLQTIWQGQDTTENRPIIVKILINPHPRIWERIQAIRSLTHDGILQTYDCGQNLPHRPYIIQENINWLNLQDFVSSAGNLTPDLAMVVMSNLLKAMTYAHENSLIHGNIHPSVIYIQPPNIKIGDFGLSPWDETWPIPMGKSDTKSLVFTPPELLSEGAVPTFASDVYSLGLLFVYLWTGRFCTGISDKKIPDILLPILGKATHQDPSQRYNNAREFLEAFPKTSEVINRKNDTTAILKGEIKSVIPVERILKMPNGTSIILPEKFVVRDDSICCHQDDSIMLPIPCGYFIMGSAENSDEGPVHEVFLNHYLIDKFPVTNFQYRQFLEYIRSSNDHSRCHSQEPPGKDHTPKWWDTEKYQKYSISGDSPVIWVDWWDAYAYAAWACKSLPTEAQWEKAARGSDGRKYPWGNQSPTYEHANHNFYRGHTNPILEYPKSASSYGCLDMAGNVLEWCFDSYDKNFYIQGMRENPICVSSHSFKVARGGAWNSQARFLQTTYRGGWHQNIRASYIGFRCVKTF